jgi:uncharacterized membrane protein
MRKKSLIIVARKKMLIVVGIIILGLILGIIVISSFAQESLMYFAKNELIGIGILVVFVILWCWAAKKFLRYYKKKQEREAEWRQLTHNMRVSEIIRFNKWTELK